MMSISTTGTGGYGRGSGVFGTQVHTKVTWGVNDGGGAPYTTTAFARATGDAAGVRRVEDDPSTARSLAGWCWAGVGAGGLLAVIGFASRPDYSPTFCGHDDGAECDAEAAAWEREYDAQETGASVAATIGVIGASAGLLGAMVVPLTAKQKAQFIAEYYTPAEAARLIESFNAGLRAELSLSEADVQGIDLGGRAPVVPAAWIAVAPSGVVLSGRF